MDIFTVNTHTPAGYLPHPFYSHLQVSRLPLLGPPPPLPTYRLAASLSLAPPSPSSHLQVSRLPLLGCQRLLPPGRGLLCPQQRLPGSSGLLT